MATNRHGVPKKQWKQWRGRPQAAFNRMWYAMHSVTKFGVPQKLSAATRRVIRWNACWMAADVTKEIEKDAAAGILTNVKIGAN